MAEDTPQQAKPKLGHRLSAWAYQAFCGLLRITDVRAVALFGRGAGFLVWLCAPSRRRIVARNLRIVLDPRCGLTSWPPWCAATWCAPP